MDAAIKTTNMNRRADEIAIACYINEVPDFVEAELVRLYHTLHSSMAYFRIFRSADKLSCYVASRDGVPVTILLFLFANGTIKVVNEMIEIDPAELSRFAQYMFANFPLSSVISFKAVKTDAAGFPFPFQKSSVKETYVIALPATPEEYTASLGKSTRTGVRYQLNKVRRDHPSFVSRFYVNEEIDEAHVRAILRMSEERITAQAFSFSHDTERVLGLLKTCGFVHVLFIDGRVCGGSVNYRVGSGCFGEAIGQHPDYEKYGLGKLTVYLTVCESIAMGCRKFYLGGGRFDFKSRMLGVLQEMDRLDIYRSRAKMLLNIDKAGKVVVDGYVRQLKTWLRKNEEKALARFVVSSFYSWKNMRKKDR